MVTLKPGQISGPSTTISTSGNFSGPIASLDYSNRHYHLAVACGPSVDVLKENHHGRSQALYLLMLTNDHKDVWTFQYKIPLPQLDIADHKLPLEVRSVHWVKSAPVLLICYLNHGIRYVFACHINLLVNDIC